MPRLDKDATPRLHSRMPRTFGAYKEIGRAFWAEGSLGVQLYELLRIKSAQLAHCNH